jgi:hypothetical protein
MKKHVIYLPIKKKKWPILVVQRIVSFLKLNLPNLKAAAEAKKRKIKIKVDKKEKFVSFLKYSVTASRNKVKFPVVVNNVRVGRPGHYKFLQNTFVSTVNGKNLLIIVSGYILLLLATFFYVWRIS